MPHVARIGLERARHTAIVLRQPGQAVTAVDANAQLPDAGLEETFAESGARFVANPSGLQQAWPKLHAYWAAGPHGAAEEALLPTEAVETESVEPAAAIGTAEFTGDGSIRLDLRAEDEEGAIGHAMLTFPPGDPAHEGRRAHLAAGSAAEAAATGPMLFWPAAPGGAG